MLPHNKHLTLLPPFRPFSRSHLHGSLFLSQLMPQVGSHMCETADDSPPDVELHPPSPSVSHNDEQQDADSSCFYRVCKVETRDVELMNWILTSADIYLYFSNWLCQNQTSVCLNITIIIVVLIWGSTGKYDMYVCMYAWINVMEMWFI